MSLSFRTWMVGLLGAVFLATAAPSRAAEPDQFAVASDARLGGDEAQTRFVIDLSRKIDLRAFTLANPYRVVLDMPQVNFQLPAKVGEKGRGLVKAFRFGLVMQGGSRVVLDLAKPARIEKSFVLEAANGQPARLVLDLAAIDRDAFMRNIALDNRAPDGATRKSNVQPTQKQDDPRPMVVIDPGHGGIDQGTQAAKGYSEKDIVLEFALVLRDKLEKTGKYRVAMTRADDTFVPLGERVAFARARQAGLFISIHADSLARREGEAQGASVYTLAEQASDAEAARLAEAENRADAISGVDLSSEPGDVADILIDLAQRETKTFSMKFAQSLVGELRNTAKLHKNPLKSAGFMVLKAPDVPSVLVELGYVTSQSDLKALTSNVWRDKTAEALTRAVDQFFGTRVAGTGVPGRN